MRPYKFCPYCTNVLIKNGQDKLGCVCGWINWDNPIPVAATLVPFPKGEYEVGSKISNLKYPDNVLETGILLVQRGMPPFKGGWCLPCGYIDSYEHPQVAAAREVLEETGVNIKLEKILDTSIPVPERRNQIVLMYLGRPVGGYLIAGDDADDVGIFSQKDMPDICFGSHKLLVHRWYSGEFSNITGVDLKK